MTTTQKLSEMINALEEYKESLNTNSTSYSISTSVSSASICNFPIWYVDFVKYADKEEDCFEEDTKEKEQKERVDNIMNKYGLI